MSLPTDDAGRKNLPVMTYITEYFPDALLAEVAVAVAGNNQHNPGQPLHWARHKSTDQINTAFRHMFDHKMGTVKDTDGTYHLAKAIWRLKAELQLTIEAERLGITVPELVDRVKRAHEVNTKNKHMEKCDGTDTTCPGDHRPVGASQYVEAILQIREEESPG